MVVVKMLLGRLIPTAQSIHHCAFHKVRRLLVMVIKKVVLVVVMVVVVMILAAAVIPITIMGHER